MMSTFSRQQRSVFWVCVSILIFICLWMGATVRRTSLIKEMFDMDFTNAQAIAIANDIPKSKAYAVAGFSSIYSDGVTVPARAMYFSPSYNDIICQLGSADAKNMCSTEKSSLGYTSKMDDTMITKPSFDCTKNVSSLALEPLNPNDSMVRIFNGMYEFVKVCVTTPIIMRDPNVIIMDPTSYGAKMLTLARPAFVSGPLSKVYSVTGPVVTTEDSNEDLFDSTSKSVYSINVSEVTDPMVTGAKTQQYPSLYNMLQQMLQDSTTGGAIPISMSMFYTKYQQKSLVASTDATSTTASGMVVTLYIDVPANVVPGQLYASTALNLFLDANDTNQGNDMDLHARTMDDGAVTPTDHFLPVRPDSFVVVTYTSSLLVMTAFSRATDRRVTHRTFAGRQFPAFTAAELDNAAAKYPAPHTIYPYDNTCIPNLADVALKMGFL